MDDVHTTLLKLGCTEKSSDVLDSVSIPNGHSSMIVYRFSVVPKKTRGE